MSAMRGMILPFSLELYSHTKRNTCGKFAFNAIKQLSVRSSTNISTGFSERYVSLFFTPITSLSYGMSLRLSQSDVNCSTS